MKKIKLALVVLMSSMFVSQSFSKSISSTDHNKYTEMIIKQNFVEELEDRELDYDDYSIYINGKLTCEDYYKVIYLLDLKVLEAVNFNHKAIHDYARFDLVNFKKYFVKNKRNEIKLNRLYKKYSVPKYESPFPTDLSLTQKFVEKLEDKGIDYDDIWIYL